MRVYLWMLLLVQPALLACDTPPSALALPGAKGAAPDFWVSPGISGAWFNPARSGEGWIIELQPDGSAIAVWFTHAPASEAAGQRWILAQNGVVSANRIEFAASSTLRGGRFGPGFDPAEVQITAWGTLIFEFDDCGHGRVTFAGREGYGEGSHPIVRLVGLHEVDCGGARALTSFGARAASGLRNRSGTWFDSTHNGEGLILQALSGSEIAVTWFTYTPDGEPAWLLGVGTLGDDGVLRVEQMVRPGGTRFGAGFDSAAVVNEPWGRLEIALPGNSCSMAGLAYTADAPDFGSGMQSLQRLTTAAGAICLEQFAPARSSGAWSQGAAQPQPASEVAVAAVGADIYVAGSFPTGRAFQLFNTQTNSWTVLPPLPGGRDHALAVSDGSDFWMFGGYRSGPDLLSPGWRYDASSQQFETVGATPLAQIAASGAAYLDGWFYLGNVDGSLVQFDPRSGAHRVIAPQVPGERDHAALVAYLGELWLIGGRRSDLIEFNTVSIYDPVGERWRYGPFLRESRAGFAAAVLDHQIMLAGGERLATNRGVIRSMEVLAAGADAWSPGPDLPVAVHGVGAAVVDGRLYLPGGSTSAGGALNPGVLQIYQPNP